MDVINGSPSWLALMIGNSRLHWARFTGPNLVQAWDTPHGDPAVPPSWAAVLRMPDAETDGPIGDLWIASVVPSQLQVWQSLPNVHCLSLADVPLAGMYPTLGIDRALAVVGAIASVGAPVLVIDGGTALTFNGAVHPSTFLGGAILPGLGLQIKALHQGTAALPELAPLASGLPGRWAQNTEAAIAAGVVYTLLASIQSFVEDWQQRFPASAIVITGGDSDRLHTYLQQTHPDLAAQILVDPYLVFRGMQIVKQGKTTL